VTCRLPQGFGQPRTCVLAGDFHLPVTRSSRCGAAMPRSILNVFAPSARATIWCRGNPNSGTSASRRADRRDRVFAGAADAGFTGTPPSLCRLCLRVAVRDTVTGTAEARQRRMLRFARNPPPKHGVFPGLPAHPSGQAQASHPNRSLRQLLPRRVHASRPGHAAVRRAPQSKRPSGGNQHTGRARRRGCAPQRPVSTPEPAMPRARNQVQMLVDASWRAR